jgi:hypothetical protein
MMTEIFAKGDLVLDRVPEVSPSGTVSQNAEGAAMVLAEGSTPAKSPRLFSPKNLNSDNLPALDGLSARKSHELVLLEHSMVAVLQPRLVHDHHAQS